MKRLAWACVLAIAAIAAGCGEDENPRGVTLTVTRDFGAEAIATLQSPQPESGDEAVDVLLRHTRAQVAEDGSVLAINQLQAGDGARWTAFINGIAPKDDEKAEVHDGDSVWWDLHDARAGEPKAVVGAFPEPFLGGIDGRRLPVKVECADPDSAACQNAVDALTALGVVAARAVLRGPRTEHTLRVLVGPWTDLREDESLAQIDEGPGVSGVFLRPSSDGREFAALDASGEVVGTFGAGTGLIAATRFGDEQPVWAVTGTDEAGVESAVSALNESVLARALAVLIADGEPTRLPVGDQSDARERR